MFQRSAFLVLTADQRAAAALGTALRSRLSAGGSPVPVLTPPMSSSDLSDPGTVSWLQSWWDTQRTGVPLSATVVVALDSERQIARVGRYGNTTDSLVANIDELADALAGYAVAASFGTQRDAPTTRHDSHSAQRGPRKSSESRHGFLPAALVTGGLVAGGWLLSAALHPGDATAATMDEMSGAHHHDTQHSQLKSHEMGDKNRPSLLRSVRKSSVAAIPHHSVTHYSIRPRTVTHKTSVPKATQQTARHHAASTQAEVKPLARRYSTGKAATKHSSPLVKPRHSKKTVQHVAGAQPQLSSFPWSNGMRAQLRQNWTPQQRFPWTQALHTTLRDGTASSATHKPTVEHALDAAGDISTPMHHTAATGKHDSTGNDRSEQETSVPGVGAASGEWGADPTDPPPNGEGPSVDGGNTPEPRVPINFTDPDGNKNPFYVQYQNGDDDPKGAGQDGGTDIPDYSQERGRISPNYKNARSTGEASDEGIQDTLFGKEPRIDDAIGEIEKDLTTGTSQLASGPEMLPDEPGSANLKSVPVIAALAWQQLNQRVIDPMKARSAVRQQLRLQGNLTGESPFDEPDVSRAGPTSAALTNPDVISGEVPVGDLPDPGPMRFASRSLPPDEIDADENAQQEPLSPDTLAEQLNAREQAGETGYDSAQNMIGDFGQDTSDSSAYPASGSADTAESGAPDNDAGIGEDISSASGDEPAERSIGNFGQEPASDAPADTSGESTLGDFARAGKLALGGLGSELGWIMENVTTDASPAEQQQENQMMQQSLEQRYNIPGVGMPHEFVDGKPDYTSKDGIDMPDSDLQDEAANTDTPAPPSPQMQPQTPTAAPDEDGFGTANSAIDNGISNAGSALGDGFGNAAFGLATGVGTAGTDVSNGFGNAASDMTNGFGSAASDMTSGLSNAGSAVASGVSTAGSDMGSGLASAGTDITNGISSGASSFGNNPSGAASSVGTGISNAASDVGTGVSNAASSVGTGISNAASDVGTGVSNAASAVGGGISSAASDVGTGVSDAASAVGSGIGDAASSVGTGISDAASSVGSGISDAASSVSNAASSL